MALTPSKMTPLGTQAPDFSLKSTTGKIVSLSDFADKKVVLVMFICNHCPYVKHVREELARFGREYQAKGVAIVGINSNDATSHPDDSFENMVKEVKNVGYTFPYLYDETQEVAKAYGAACTPDFFLFDGRRRLIYRGQFDDSRPGNEIPVTGKDLRAATDSLFTGTTISTKQKPSLGCNIKWKPGNEPA